VKRAILVLFLLALGGRAFAQAPGGPERPAREELFKMVDAYIISNLQESLALTDEQFVKLLPLVKKTQGDRRMFAQRRNLSLLEMGRLLESGTATEARVGELLKDFKQRELDDAAAQRKNLEAIDAQLSVVQQAKLRILMARVEQNIREIVNRARPQGGAGARPRREGFGGPNP
jgi:hypothetical protein